MLGLSGTNQHTALGTVITVIAGMLAVGGVYADTFHHAYIGYFFDKITFMVGCL